MSDHRTLSLTLVINSFGCTRTHFLSSKSVYQVFSNIRLFITLACSVGVFFSPIAMAQEQPNTQVETTSQSESKMTNIKEPVLKAAKQDAEQTPLKIAPAPTLGAKQQPILRLEDTIRGNKEQPQVLTIVPWQLPVHQRINESTEWRLQVSQLTSIERNAFLRQLAVVNELKRTQAKPILTSDSAFDAN